jgi:hypothetical protein
MIDRESLRRAAFDLSQADQFWLAFVIAENLGYVLRPESSEKKYRAKAVVADYIARAIACGELGMIDANFQQKALICEALRAYWVYNRDWAELGELVNEHIQLDEGGGCGILGNAD